MTDEILIAFASGILIILGGLGSFLPILPGVPLSYGGLFLYAWYTGFDKISTTALVIFGVLTVLSFALDFFAPALGAKGYKASSYGVVGSLLGAFLGVFILGPLGIILGPFIGGFMGELLNNRGVDTAIHVAYGSFIGLVVGSLLKLGIVSGMLIYFVYSSFL